MSNIINVGISGLGRSGWNIHAKTLATMPEKFKVVAATDNVASRREEANAAGIRAYETFDQLVRDSQVQLMVIATPSSLHAPQTIESVQRGKDVVCEKPMTTSSALADEMIRAAESAGRLLTGFHNKRYSGEFLKIKEVIASGKLGRIVQIKIAFERFNRRWDWQTLKEFGGGTLNNAGAHAIDLALQLFGPAEPEVWVDMQRALTSGDAEDHVKVMMRAKGAPTIDIELSSAAAYPAEHWNVMGSAGGMHGSEESLEWKWVDFSKVPPREVDKTPTAADRKYPNEVLPWQQDSWKETGEFGSDFSRFYHDLYDTIRNGKPLGITAQSVRRTIATLEKCRAMGNV